MLLISLLIVVVLVACFMYGVVRGSANRPARTDPMSSVSVVSKEPTIVRHDVAQSAFSIPQANAAEAALRDQIQQKRAVLSAIRMQERMNAMR